MKSGHQAQQERETGTRTPIGTSKGAKSTLDRREGAGRGLAEHVIRLRSVLLLSIDLPRPSVCILTMRHIRLT